MNDDYPYDDVVAENMAAVEEDNERRHEGDYEEEGPSDYELDQEFISQIAMKIHQYMTEDVQHSVRGFTKYLVEVK